MRKIIFEELTNLTIKYTQSYFIITLYQTNIVHI